MNANRYLRIAGGYMAAAYSVNLAFVLALHMLTLFAPRYAPRDDTLAQHLLASVWMLLASVPALLAPGAVCIDIAERFNFRGAGYYVASGTLVGVAGANIFMFVLAPIMEKFEGHGWPNYAWWEIGVVHASGVPLGMVWGAVYWYIAGRNTGRL